MLVIDSRPTFLSELGKPLAAGRLSFFAYNTTTPAVVYSDPEFTIPTGTTIDLTSAGWLPYEVYSDISLTIEVQEFIGVDEFGNNSYNTLKTLTLLLDQTQGTAVPTIFTVDTIQDLRDLDPEDGDLVAVKGYYAPFDAPVRLYKFSSTATGLENLGTILESTQTSIGRWLYQQAGKILDARIFGLIPGVSTINSHFTQACAYCASAGYTLHFPSGTYILAGGGSYTATCDISCADGVQITAQSLYTLTMTGELHTNDTFAGTNLSLILTGATGILPVTAWNGGMLGASLSTAPITLYANADKTITGLTGSPMKFREIRLNEGNTLTLDLVETLRVQEVTGKGRIQLLDAGLDCAGTIRKSQIVDEASVDKVLIATSGTFIFDEIYTGGLSDLSTSANIRVDKKYTPTNLVEIRGSFACSQGVLAGPMKFHIPILGEWFEDGTPALLSFSLSPDSPSLDMQGKTTTATLATRSAPGVIKNGTIGRVNVSACDLTMEGMTVLYTGSFIAVWANRLIAHNSTISITTSTNEMIEANSLELVNCKTMRTGGSTAYTWDVAGKLYVRNHTTENAKPEVNKLNGQIDIKNADFFRMRIIGNLAQIEDISILNSKFALFSFTTNDPAAVDGAVCRRVKVSENLIDGNITVSNGGATRWAVTGHKSVDVSNNYTSAGLPCRATIFQGWVIADDVQLDLDGYNIVSLDTQNLIFTFNEGVGLVTPLTNPRPTNRAILEYGYAEIIDLWHTGGVFYETIRHPLAPGGGKFQIVLSKNPPGYTLGINQPDNTNPWQYNISWKVYP